ncbi:hypothetical protein F5X68DRAFT_166316 [Plectosphaerella plurivora]|uniref:Zn(2)-C6 fungal-type domain-containing protein n=1 Tax=Plectosphaerella plurivora TaxID=936078 RepID=A0A9P9AAZ1_9PEZI|nr:hypothetical protein F5X68DRAFT_166316 [Plectosphaerella plurivora]
MATQAQPLKKVRLACQRCRARRTKCDGQVPACTNCTKAGEICLDVDSQNPAVLIPRNFAAAAQARIQWLEEIIRGRLPDIDLNAGPKVDAPPDPRGSLVQPDGEIDMSSSTTSMKRRADSDATSLAHETFPEQAHSLSVNLGMLSLNSDSNQKHYLGSSSGRLFANLIGASPSSDGSSPAVVNDNTIMSTMPPEWPATPLPMQLLRQRYCSLHEILRRELPPTKKEAQQLLQAYICWIHPDFPVLDPTSLLGGLDALYATFECSLDNDALPLGWPSCAEPFRWNGRLVTPAHPGKDTVPMPVVAFITFMALNIAAITRVRSRNYEHAPEKFYRAATEFSQDCFSQISLPSIQALVTLIIHSMLTPAESNLWILLHIASAQCIELGIHREEENNETNNPEDDDQVTRQIRRSIFYTIYSLDRSIAAIQGRPLGFRDETFDVKMPQALPVAADAPYLTMHPSFSVAVVRYSTCQFELSRIVSNIKLRLYHLPDAMTAFSFTGDPSSVRDRIEGDLKAWLGRMPSATDPTLAGIDRRQRRIWQGRLQTRYHTAAVLLFQPSQMIRVPGPEQLMKCYQHACAIIDSYQLLQDLQGLHYGWRAVQNIFAAGATIIYCFWMSAAVRQNSVATDLAKTLRACTNLLILGGEWWPSAKKGQHGFGSVVDLTVQRLFSAQGPGPSRPSKTPRLTEPTNRWMSSNTGSNDGALARSDQEAFIAGGDADGSFPPDGGEVNALVPPWNGEQHCPEALWADPSIPDDTLLDIHGFIPEVEAFLADFDRSRFSWTFPLDGSNEMPDPNQLHDYHF